MCCVDLEKVFDRETRKVLEWALRKKCITEAMVRSVISLYGGAKTKTRVDSELSEKFAVKVVMHQGSVLSHFPLEMVVDVVAEIAREGALSELLYTDDLVLPFNDIQASLTVHGTQLLLPYNDIQASLTVRGTQLVLPYNDIQASLTVCGTQLVLPFNDIQASLTVHGTQLLLPFNDIQASLTVHGTQLLLPYNDIQASLTVHGTQLLLPYNDIQASLTVHGS